MIIALFLGFILGATGCADGAEHSFAAPIHPVTPANVAEPAAVPRAISLVPAPLAPTRFGFWGLNGYVSDRGFADVRARMGVRLVQTATMNPAWAVESLLPLARSAGMTVTLRLSGDHPGYTRDGNFDLAAWKQMMLVWRNSALGPFVDDGTLAGHMLLDDIDTFAGYNPNAADLDEMARFSKELIPGLMTFVRQKATEMPKPQDGRYRHLDAVVNQYKAVDGDVSAYAARQVAAAAALDVGIINGMNIADGGDGSSGKSGYRGTHFAMSAEEVLRYGTVLAQVPESGMFLCWEYDGEERWADGNTGATYFDRPDMQASFLALSKIVEVHPVVPLLRE